MIAGWNTHQKVSTLKLLELLFFAFITSAVWSFSDLKYKWDQYSQPYLLSAYIWRAFGFILALT
jgi:hypothetical protein